MLEMHKELYSNPSPGQYDFVRDNLLKKTIETPSAAKNSSSFKLPFNCRRVKVNLYDPFQKIDTNTVGKNMPGPGSYPLEKDTIYYNNLEKKASGMFSSMF